MSKTPKWTAQRVATRIAQLSSEHGVPNNFLLQEITGGGSPASMAVSRVLRLEHLRVAAALSPHGISVTYHGRERYRPASIGVEAS
jgi:hypothetical protein